jgi:hypothetical protein
VLQQDKMLTQRVMVVMAVVDNFLLLQVHKFIMLVAVVLLVSLG